MNLIITKLTELYPRLPPILTKIYRSSLSTGIVPEDWRRASARYCLNDYNFTSSVTEMLKVLNWQTLENRRIRNSLILLYEIKHNLVAVDHHHLTETKNLNFFIPYSRTRYHMNSYFPRTIRQWNSLPYSLKASSSLSGIHFWAGHCYILIITSFLCFIF